MTDNERLIKQPPNARFFMVPHEYLMICQRKKTITITRGKRKGEKETTYQKDEVAAALLYFFERWTVWKMKERSYKPGSDVWLFFSADQIQEYEFGDAFGSHRIDKAIDLLLERRYIERRNNPDKGYDRTYQYRFVLRAVQEAVNNLPPFFNIEEWKIQKRNMQNRKPENAKSENEEAIPHNPKHNQTDQKTSDPNGSGANADPEPKQPRKRSAKQIELDNMINALADAFGLDHDKVTDHKWSEFRGAGSQLVKVGAKPDEMIALHAWCKRQNWPNFTAYGMAKEYATFAKARQPARPPAPTLTDEEKAAIREEMFCGPGIPRLEDVT
jgi:hypothetical protein